jgi:hypothetical protein
MKKLFQPSSIGAIFIMIVLFGLIAQPLSAQEYKGYKRKAKGGHLQAGSWSLQFQIRNNFTLDDFQGALISCKRHYTPQSAIRLGLGLNGSISDDSRESTSTAPGGSKRINNLDADLDNQAFNLTVQYLNYPSPGARIKTFFGIGPMVGFDRRKDKSMTYSEIIFDDTLVSRSSVEFRENLRRTWSVGLSGVLGVEWFFSRKLSLLAEYGASFVYEWRKSTSSRWNSETAGSTEGEDTESTLRFNSSAVKFGLSVYL